MTELTFEKLHDIAPSGKDAILKNTVIAFNQYADLAEINTPLRQVHFIAQIAHESASFRTTVEYGGKNSRYAPWYGRGLIQTTWEANYKAFYEWCIERKYEDVPQFDSAAGRDQVARFPWAFLSAVWYWDSHNLNKYADNDDVRTITKRINGGYNGLEQRIEFLNRAKEVFGLEVTTQTDDGPSVEQIQQALVHFGYRIDVDGDMGPKTEAAIKMFQKSRGLRPDGIVGQHTIAELFK